MIVVSDKHSLCTRCHKFKVRGEFYKLRDGRCVRKYRVDSWCKRCRRRASKERVQKLRSDPETLRRYRQAQAAAMRRWRAKHPDAADAIRWRYYQRVNADPEWKARRAEAARMNHRIRAETRGAAKRSIPRSAQHYRKTLTKAEHLPRDPFVEWLRKEFPRLAPDDIAPLLGIEKKTVRAVLGGTQKTIGLTVVDRAFVHIGQPWLLNHIYPCDE